MSDIKIKCTVNRIRYYKNGFGIVVVQVDDVEKGELKTDRNNTVLKGEMPQLKEGESYNVTATFVSDPKWGDQYNINMIASAIVVTDDDTVGQRRYLESIFTIGQVDAMYDALENPYKVLKDGNAVELCKVKGCGLRKAPDWIKRFHQSLYRSRIYAELEDYNLSASIIDKLFDRYNSPDIIIEKIKTDPYILVTEVRGIGWAIADRIAVAGGMSEFDPKRVGAFIFHYLQEEGDKGFSWVTLDEIWGATIEKFGDNISDNDIREGIYHLGEELLWWNEDKTKIGLKWYYDLENKIATELIRIRDAESTLKYSNWEDAVHRIERLQGWEYTEEQINGIKKALDSNIIMIQGSSGTGKTSLVAAVLEACKHYKFVQCALSGKAASRLMEVTGKEGFTIHRLLGFPKGEENKGKFVYHDERPLQYDLIIVDEVSMIDLSLFYNLLRAVKDGTKVICLGDNGQLEAIGSGNIAYDLLTSEEIPSVTLNKIHRQAENSAIVTESVKIRNGYQIVQKDWAGHETRGNLKDLELICYSDKSNTYYEIMKAFTVEFEKLKDITAIQIIVPNKQRGACTSLINQAVQEIYNPDAKEYVSITNKDYDYELRAGDRVINTRNNYQTEPNIYNGNVGMIKRFGYDSEEEQETMIIDFDGIGEVSILAEDWKDIELAYALTVHKCQGSESDIVIFGFDFNAYSLLSKELVYTGITRAKKKCYLIAQTGALRFATGKSSVVQKQTHLKQCLHDIAHPKIIF